MLSFPLQRRQAVRLTTVVHPVPGLATARRTHTNPAAAANSGGPYAPALLGRVASTTTTTFEKHTSSNGLPPPPLPDAASAGDTPASVDGGDVRMAPEIPESAAPASVPAALPLANLQPPMGDVKRNAPTSLLAAAALSLPSPLASLPPPEKPTYCRLRQHEPRLATISSAQVLQARACSRIAKGRRLRSSPLRSEPAVPTSPASNPAASTPVLLEAEAINSQDICMGMCSRIAKGRLRSSPLRSEPAVPTSPASSPVASTPVLLEAERPSTRRTSASRRSTWACGLSSATRSSETSKPATSTATTRCSASTPIPPPRSWTRATSPSHSSPSSRRSRSRAALLYMFGIALRLWTSTGASHYVPSYSSLSPPGCGAHRAFSSRRVRDLG